MFNALGATTGRKLITTAAAAAVIGGGLVAVSTVDANADVGVHVGSTATNLRDCYHPSKQSEPSQNCTLIASIPAGTAVTLICQYPGNRVESDYYWDYVRTPNNGYGYMSDWYVNTGVHSSPYRDTRVPLCNY